MAHVSARPLAGGNWGNATQMSRPFKGKMVADFLRLKQTKDFILALESRYGDSHNGGNKEVLRVVQGGTPELQGAWMDELLALKFAAWLSPHFEIWVYERMKALILTGRTEVRNFHPGGIVKGVTISQISAKSRFRPYDHT